MSMTVTQLILIVFALVAMFWGLYILYQALKKSSNHQTVIDESQQPAQLEQGKDGLPILPRHQRPEVDETFAAEITPDNPEGDIVLSGENTEFNMPKPPQFLAESAAKNEASSAAADKTALNSVEPEDPTEYQVFATEVTPQLQTVSSATETDSPTDTILTPADGDDAFSMLASATETITPVVHTFDENQLKKEVFVESSPILDTHIQAQVAQEQNSPLNNAVQNINISIFPNEQFARISGKDLLMLTDKYGMKYGAMNMFHRYEHKDGTGLLWFSMMMITEDGVMPFDLNRLPTQLIKGLVLFLSLPHPKAVQGFDSMMSVAGLMAHDLHATVYDETGEPINKENVHVLREIAVEFGNH